MSETILIVHYTPPRVVGGVESVIERHAELLAKRGYQVSFVAGSGEGWTEFPLQVIPEIDVARPESVRLEGELDMGVVGEDFFNIQERILHQLTPLADEADIVMAHNAFTLHFSLPLTAALWQIAEHRQPGSMIAWCHDLSWSNPLYRPTMRDAWPWNLLRRRAPNTRYVMVSEERKMELERLWHGEEGISVIPNGIDAAEFLGLSRETKQIVARYSLFDRDLVLLLPVRITRRKNIEVAIRTIRILKDQDLDVRFLISGPQAPHHPTRSHQYLEELKELRASLDLEQEVVFLADDLGRNLEQRTVAELYRVSDVLLFPSAQEGFGLPILEAGLARVPVVVSDIPIFRELAGRDGFAFELELAADRIAETVLRALDAAPARLYRRTLRNYRWDIIADHRIIPLLKERAWKEALSNHP